MVRGKPLKDRTKEFSFLLTTLVTLLVLYPVFSGWIFGEIFSDIVLSTVLLAGVLALDERPRLLRIGLFLAVPAFFSKWLLYFYFHPQIMLFSQVTLLLFFSFAAIMVLARILKEDEISTDTILGGISVYLLIGIIWALLLSIVLMLDHDAFRGLDIIIAEMEAGSRSQHRLYPLLYFSFVTLTTLGYGDIVPLSSTARALVVAEAVLGQLYLTIFVARLVGMYISDRLAKRGR